MPGAHDRSTPPFECVICGDRGLADAILNVALFIPLGAALGLSGWSGFLPYVFAPLLSGTVEVTQLFVPGRDTSIGDVLFNTLGAAVGLWVVGRASVFVRPCPKLAGKLALAASLVVSVVWVATGYLLAPALPRGTYSAQWTPLVEGLEPYHGRVVGAWLGPLQIGPARRLESRDFRLFFLDGAALNVTALAGPLSESTAPILRLRDDRERQVVLLAAEREDLAFYYANRADVVRLDHPDLRLLGAFGGIAEGDSLWASVRRSRNAFCMALGDLVSCSIGYTLGIGWGLLLYMEWAPVWVRAALNVLWMTVLVVPMGFWLRANTASLTAVGALFTAALLVPRATGLLPTPVLEFVGLLLGLGAGYGLHRLACVLVPTRAV